MKILNALVARMLKCITLKNQAAVDTIIIIMVIKIFLHSYLRWLMKLGWKF